MFFVFLTAVRDLNNFEIGSSGFEQVFLYACIDQIKAKHLPTNV